MSESQRSTSRRSLGLPIGLLASLLILVVLAVGHEIWLGFLGDQLVAADPLEPADAIVVLAGHSPARFEHGLGLYRAGYAPLLIVSDEEVMSHGFMATWSELYQRGLAAEAAPRDALRVLPPSASTYEEALASRDLMIQLGLSSTIVVTDPFHSRRAAMTFASVFREAGLSVRASPAENPDADVERWWQGEKKAASVLLEYAKLGYYALRGRL